MDWKKPKSSGDGEKKDFPETIKWSPEEADELVGILKRKSSVKTKYDKSGYVTVLEVEDIKENLYTIWCTRTALKNLVAENDQELIVGRPVAIRTDGKQELDDGRTYFPYELAFPTREEAGFSGSQPVNRAVEEEESF